MSPKREKLKLCCFPGCKVLTTNRHCPIHTKSHRANRSPQARASIKFLHSSAWLNIRKLKLSQTPWCEECERNQVSISVPATDVDHIKPRHLAPELKLTFSNLQSLCKSCHSKKTQREDQV